MLSDYNTISIIHHLHHYNYKNHITLLFHFSLDDIKDLLLKYSLTMQQRQQFGMRK